VDTIGLSGRFIAISNPVRKIKRTTSGSSTRLMTARPIRSARSRRVKRLWGTKPQKIVTFSDRLAVVTTIILRRWKNDRGMILVLIIDLNKKGTNTGGNNRRLGGTELGIRRGASGRLGINKR